MRKTTIVLIIILALFSTSCTLFQKKTDEMLLRSELKRWEKIKGDGTIELSAFGITMRKPFTLSKNVNELRLDVVEGGIFGSGGSPILSMYLGPYLALNSTAIPALAATNLEGLIPEGITAVFATADHLFDKYGEEILEKKAVERENVIVSFAQDYKLEEIRDKKSGTQIKAQYNRSGDIDSIDLKTGSFISAKMVFDSVVYEQANIIPLPKTDKTGGSIMDMFKGNNMFDLLRGFLGD
ncbi:MAG: hypothetical protein GX106_00170 [Candidatus Cloacimonetes bacterium]|jgi:hypothetical protein|nr:hypothetical protein [Candidatus Cloacimonadota bacterium]